MNHTFCLLAALAFLALTYIIVQKPVLQQTINLAQ